MPACDEWTPLYQVLHDISRGQVAQESDVARGRSRDTPLRLAPKNIRPPNRPHQSLLVRDVAACASVRRFDTYATSPSFACEYAARLRHPTRFLDVCHGCELLRWSGRLVVQCHPTVLLRTATFFFRSRQCVSQRRLDRWCHLRA